MVVLKFLLGLLLFALFFGLFAFLSWVIKKHGEIIFIVLFSGGLVSAGIIACYEIGNLFIGFMF